MVIRQLLLTLALAWVSQAVQDYHDPHCGGRQVIVQMFEWKWTDIAAECERYLGPKEFCGVQVSPPQEHVVVTTDAMRPWWERYQPVSYKVISRSGNETEFKDMVDRCKNVGVRIFVDSIINHMAGLGRSGIGIGGSSFDSDARDFPGVPYTSANFHTRDDCPSGDGNVNNYGDPNNVRDCYLVALTDLDGAQDYVREKVAGYMNHLISLGVAGFRVDAAKHMWPADIEGIQAKLNDLPEGGKPFFAHEVIDRNDGAIKVDEYFHLGWVTEFRYLQKVREGANDLGRLASVYDPGWGMAPPEHAFIFVDNHDTQRGHDSLTYKNGDEYKRAVAFTLANDYGFTRIISGYDFTNNEEGPPHESDYTTKDVTINADGSCGNGWVCEHRWKPIGNMARFRAAVTGTSRDNFKYENGVMSMNRGDKGFFAMAHQGFNINVYTGLPAGDYCDLISECAQNITVDDCGMARVSPQDSMEPYVAIIARDDFYVPALSDPNVTCSLPDPGSTGSTGSQVTATPWVPSGDENFNRTIILFERRTSPGENLFIRGGIDAEHRDGCDKGGPGSPCSIPIKALPFPPDNHYDAVRAWSQGDNYLDWEGSEPGQGQFQGHYAEGTPAFWSTTNPSHPGNYAFNTFGEHYWVVDIEMDCNKTEDGYFELKGIINGGWEVDITQASCTGSAAGTPPYTSKNHFGRCGYLNVYHFNEGRCEIEPIPS